MKQIFIFGGILFIGILLGKVSSNLRVAKATDRYYLLMKQERQVKRELSDTKTLLKSLFNCTHNAECLGVERDIIKFLRRKNEK